ncbi:hypothetical protein [uncultured Sphingomonas sp.]|uniref:hypothetical protein n=2 Tax=Sphingomonas TaxID=13687 RepID=UPI00260494B5|nr:hypothetical protein [uncultured Sphingomonas sp.]
MMFLLAIVTFGAALGIAAYAIAASVAPNLTKIRLALAGRSPLAMALATEPLRVERRVAVRRPAAAPVRRPAPLRAAA